MRGYQLAAISLPSVIREQVLARDWPALDRAIALETIAGGAIFDELRKYASFSQIEFILSIRSSIDEPDEDGIWHDDGSRVLAFSLSLTLRPEAIEGGRLQIRKRGDEPFEHVTLATPPYGTMIVFATGHLGYEHKIGCVTQGERIIAAGWCT